MAFSNTESLSTNLNVSPYFDDFDESKNFHRILFRPGFGVQARELTQLQSILQNQIDRFGEHVFREGSVVKGCEFFYNNPINYIKLRDDDENGTSVNALAFVNSTVTGATNSVEANVFFAVGGSEASDPNLKTLFLKYTKSSSDGSTRAFVAGEKITATGLSANVATATQTTSPVGNGSIFSVGEGIIFAKDHFIRVAPQDVIVSRYNANASVRVGFTINETIVTSANDATLTDPASGSFNFAAPGANRLKLNPVLTVQPLSNTSTVNFVEIAQIEKGELKTYKQKPQYAQFRDYLADRTFDESGNYTVRGLSVRLREDQKNANNGGVFTAADGGSANSLSVDVDSGKAYVRGFDIEKLSTTHIQIDKGIDFLDVEDVTVTNQYGNYVLVNEVSGTWDINLHANVNILSTEFRSVSNGDYSTTTGHVGRPQIGTARVRSIVPESGTLGSEDAQYRLYLYDVKMTNGAFSEAKSFYYPSSADAVGKADAVLTSGNATLNEGSFKKAVYPVGFGSVRRIKDSAGASDTDYEFMRAFNSLTIANTGAVTATSPNANELFPYTQGSTVSSPDDKFYLVFDAFANTVALEGTVTASDASNSFSRASGSTDFTDYLNVGDVLKVATHSNTFTISSVAATTFTTLEPAAIAITSKPFFKNFPQGKVVTLEGKGMGTGGGATAPTAGASRTVTIGTPATSATIDIKEPLSAAAAVSLLTSLNISNATQIAKTLKIKRRVQINTASNIGGTSGPWSLGYPDVLQIESVRLKSGSGFSTLTEGTDVTSDFELDNGQRDGIYGLAQLKLKSTSSLSISSGDRLLVSLQYFSHDRSGGIGHLTVDSYPVNDSSGQSNTEIRTEDIPIFTSPVDGQQIDLRNSIDYRPIVELTATDTDAIGSMSTDPANTHTVDSTSITSGQGLRFPRPNENATVDLSFYQGRNDLIVMEPSGDVRAVRGTPSNSPKFPIEPDNSMTIAKVRVSPFPSLPAEQARRSDREDLQSTIEPVKNRRFTMKDIGALANRIDNLEYYTSLSLLEKTAKDLFIADASGADRFKNGILVDKFSGHGVGNPTDLDYSIAIDRTKSEARPQGKNREVPVQFNLSSSTNVIRRAREVRLTHSGGANIFSNGETVTVGAASGTLRYQVSPSDGAEATRLYLENATGTFTVGGTITGGTSGTTATLSAVQRPSNGKAATLTYGPSVVIEQPFGTATRNVTGLFYNHIGNVTLTPDSDYWIDTTRNPDIQVNFDSQADNFLQTANPFETEFGFDETIVFGSTSFGFSDFDNATRTQEIQLNQNGTNITLGARNQLVPFTDAQAFGGRQVDSNVVPFIRSRLLNVRGTGFKPSSRLYAFFDGEDVSDYITPMNSAFSANTGAEGSPLLSDASGNVNAFFRIPNNDELRFRVGDRRFRLTDSSTNSDVFGQVTTSGEAQYSTQALPFGAVSSIVSTITPTIVNDTLQNSTVLNQIIDTRATRIAGDAVRQQRGDDNRNDRGGPNPDPIAQTFTVKDFVSTQNISFMDLPGIYVTKLDLFFERKDAVSGVTVEIRETDGATSFITNRQVPLAKVTVATGDVNISSDGSAPTPFIFPTPIFLRSDIEYAVVVKPENGSPNYRVFTARLGETDLVTGNRVSKQPAMGLLFASANDRQYTPIQEEDLKFTLYRCDFKSLNGTAFLENEPKDFFTVTGATATFDNTGEIIQGETTLTLGSTVTANAGEFANGATSGTRYRVILANTTAAATNTVRVLGQANIYSFSPTPYTASETINFVFANGQATGKSATLSSQSTPTGRLEFYDPRTASNTFMFLANSSGDFVAGRLVIGQLSGAEANVSSIDNLTVHRLNAHLENLTPLSTDLSANAKFALTTSTLDTAFRPVDINEGFSFDSERLLLSRSNEVSGLSSAKSAQLRAIMSSSSSRLSPYIRLDRSTFSVTENRVNNDSTSEDGISGGNALAKYITRTVTLADGQDAEDLKVLLAAYAPSSSTIEVYYKILNDGDEGPISERNYVQMTRTTPSATVSDPVNQNDFVELEFNVPTANKTGGNGEVQYTVESATFTGFKRFLIKIVLLTSDATNPPRLKDFRAIALQI